MPAPANLVGIKAAAVVALKDTLFVGRVLLKSAAKAAASKTLASSLGSKMGTPYFKSSVARVNLGLRLVNNMGRRRYPLPTALRLVNELFNHRSPAQRLRTANLIASIPTLRPVLLSAFGFEKNPSVRAAIAKLALGNPPRLPSLSAPRLNAPPASAPSIAAKQDRTKAQDNALS